MRPRASAVAVPTNRTRPAPGVPGAGPCSGLPCGMQQRTAALRREPHLATISLQACCGPGTRATCAHHGRTGGARVFQHSLQKQHKTNGRGRGVGGPPAGPSPRPAPPRPPSPPQRGRCELSAWRFRTADLCAAAVGSAAAGGLGIRGRGRSLRRALGRADRPAQPVATLQRVCLGSHAMALSLALVLDHDQASRSRKRGLISSALQRGNRKTQAGPVGSWESGCFSARGASTVHRGQGTVKGH